MVQISLKRLIAKKDVLAILKDMISAIESPVNIQDLDGKSLIGGEYNHLERYPIEPFGELIGWVGGGEKAAPVALLLTYLASRELEKKALARETLDKYKEITLLYDISEKISASLDLQEVGALVLEEARKLIPATSGSVMLLDETTGKLKIISAFGQENDLKAPLEIGKGIAGNVILTGVGEIINDVMADPRFIVGQEKFSSLLCTPLKGKDRVMGVINIGSEQSIHYSAADFKLFSALTSQAAAAIENALLHENKLREERIKSNLERYVPSQVVHAILESKGEISLSPVRKDIVVLFSDIRNFTAQCEELAPETIVGYLNEYFTHMVDVIFTHEGTVNKFVGDMIVALFGAPSRVITSEVKAINAAIAMQKRIQTIPTPWIRENFNTGIGLSSGKVIVGNIGSPQHMDYTAIGDEVNVASRLQSIAKGGQILVSRSIYEATKDIFQFQDMGSLPVKGRKKTVEVFEVLY